MLNKIIKERCSVRQFCSKKIERDILVKLLEAARLAPSWMNVQPWHFIAVTEGENKKLLEEICVKQAHTAAAPCLVLCLADLSAWNDENFAEILKQKGLNEEVIKIILSNPNYNPNVANENLLKLRTAEQCTYPLAYMTLQAQELGLGCCIIGAINTEFNNYDEDLVKKFKKKLNIPDEYKIFNVLAVGYPAEDFKCPPKLRKNFENVVSFEYFNGK